MMDAEVGWVAWSEGFHGSGLNKIYHGSVVDSVTLEELTKMKRVLEEFIAETDDQILKDYSIERIENTGGKDKSEKLFIELFEI